MTRMANMEKIDCTPGPKEIDNLIRYARTLHKSSDLAERVKAFEFLEAGWPQMRLGNAIKLLKGEINIEQALEL